jgi:hypothetical protein
MSGTGYDPDFIVTIDGENVTKYVNHWVLTDTEKKSSLVVTLKNPDQKLSSKFDTGQDVSIIFGYVGNMGEQVTMTIKKYEESYSVEEDTDFIKVTGLDCLDATEGDNNSGGGQSTIDRVPSKVN